MRRQRGRESSTSGLRSVQGVGWTNDQNGRRLHLSEGTVRTHLNNVYERLGVQSRTAAVAAVYRDAG